MSEAKRNELNTPSGYDRAYPYHLKGRRGSYYWWSETTGSFSWGTFKTKKEAREKMGEYLKSF